MINWYKKAMDSFNNKYEEYIPKNQLDIFRKLKEEHKYLTKKFVDLITSPANEENFTKKREEENLVEKIRAIERKIHRILEEPEKIMEKQRSQATKREQEEKKLTEKRYKTVKNIGGDLEQFARNYFSITDNPYLAGYMLDNGDMLAFSYHGDQRDIDHRQVYEAFPENTDIDSGYHGMKQFMLATNAIRMNIHKNFCGFDLVNEPTRSQLRKMFEIIENIAGEITINYNGVEKNFEQYDLDSIAEFLGHSY